MVNSKRKTIIEEFYYDTEEDRQCHANIMKILGYFDSGQVEENTSTLDNPEYKLYGRYYKYE